MGPRSDERGSSSSTFQTSGLRLLQWGRALTSAEVARLAFKGFGVKLLQWGRALTSAEVAGEHDGTRSGRMLQWGRALTSAEVNLPGKPGCPVRAASMGPRSDERGSVK